MCSKCITKISNIHSVACCSLSMSVFITAFGRKMPRKIGFVVVSSSGYEDGYSPKELMVHAPTINGWRSAR